MSKCNITKVWGDDTHVFAMIETELTANYVFSQWPKLAKATREQRRIINCLIPAYIGLRMMRALILSPCPMPMVYAQ